MSCQANPLAEWVKTPHHAEMQHGDRKVSLAEQTFSENFSSLPRNSLVGDLESTSAYQAKQVKQTIPVQTVLEPQFGLETIASSQYALAALQKVAGVDVPQVLAKELEGIVLLLTALSQQTTILGVTTAIMLHMRAYFSSSVIGMAKGVLDDMFGTDLKTQSGLEEPLTPDWLECLRNVKLNWHLCKHNKAFGQFSKLLGLLATTGLCRIADLEFSIGAFKIFTPTLADKHQTAFDLADALFETVLFFTEGMYLCFKTGSLKPLLINDHSALEMDEEYALIMSWWELVKHGNLKKFANIADQDFERRLNELTTKLKNLLPSLKAFDKKLIADKFTRCLNMQNDFVTMKIASGVRRSPFAIQLFGESSQGKTTLGDQLVDALLTSGDLPTDKRFRAAFNAGDKYMSNWTSDKLVLFFDDCSNEKSNFVERPPTRAILDVCNNQMYYANKAELSAKGKCFVEPWIAVVTTNKKDLDAGLYSNCPYSIQRRLINYTVRAKPQFQKSVDGMECGIDATKVREYYTNAEGDYVPPEFDDIWLVTVEEAIKPEKMTTVAKYASVKWRGILLENVSMATVIQYSVEKFQEHTRNQDALLAGMKARENRMVKCGHKDCPHIRGNCPDHKEDPVDIVCPLVEDKHEPHFGKETVKSVSRLSTFFQSTIVPDIWAMEKQVDKTASELIYKTGMKYLRRWDWIKFVPHSCFEHEHSKNCMRFFFKDKLKGNIRIQTQSVIVALLSAIMMIRWCVPQIWAMPLYLLVVYQAFAAQRDVVNRVETDLFESLKKRNLIVHPIIRKYRDDSAKLICGACFSIAVIYALSQAYRAWRAHESHGSLEPKTQAEIDQRDSETNVWTTVVQRELPISPISKCVTSDVLTQQVEKNLVYGSITLTDGTMGMINALFLNSNLVLIPNHYFDEFGDVLNCTFRKSNPEACGGKFAAVISRSASIKLDEKDLCVCYCTTGGSYVDLIKHFPLDNMPTSPFQMIFRQKDGAVVKATGSTIPMKVETVERFEIGRAHV